MGSIRLRGRAIACGNTPGFLGFGYFALWAQYAFAAVLLPVAIRPALALCAQRLACANRYRHTRFYFGAVLPFAEMRFLTLS